MESAKCPKCGFVGWADAEVCKKCGAPVAPRPTNDLAENFDNHETHYYPANTPGLEPKTGLAITSLVLGILNFLFLGLTGISIVIGIIISVVALKRAKRDPYQYGGKSLAVAGLITNIVSVVMLVPVLLIAAVAIPNFLAARRQAYEYSAMASLRRIYTAEISYQSKYRTFGTMSDLKQAALITPESVRDDRGYRFKIDAMTLTSLDGLPGFSASAVPTDYPTSGKRSFYIDESGVIRGADNHGLEASRSDPPIRFDNDSPFKRSISRRSTTNGDGDE